MTELLAPAGGMDALRAAVENGADAVYLGAERFSARARARNFTAAERREAVEYCRLRGVRVYLALNTLAADRELPALLALAGEDGIDAVLVQDLGALSALRARYPDLPLHASTQMSLHTRAGVAEAGALGLRRVVLARELTRAELAALCAAKGGVELEVFVHGALCCCRSGQCAMSAVIGGRSANRGACAQPCRLPYGKADAYPLSMKDLCLAGHVPELMDLGVDCLKIEGRMRRASYVAEVTSVYAALLREHRAATEEELRRLAAAFPAPLTDGYYAGRRDLRGTRGEEREPVPRKAAVPARRVPITLEASIRAGEPMRLTAADRDGHRVTVEGAVPEAARTRALDEAGAAARLSKCGGTVFTAERCRVTLDGGLAVSAAALNALRRDALAKLEAARLAVPARRAGRWTPSEENGAAVAGAPRFTVSLASEEQLTPALLALRPAVVSLPVERLARLDRLPGAPDIRYCAELPRAWRSADEEALRALLRTLRGRGLAAAGIGNLGHLPLARGLDLALRGDFGLNVFNSEALRLLRDLGLESAAVSFELRREQIRDLRKCLPCEALVYGRLPLMLTEIDPGAALTDRTGARFPVRTVCGGRYEIENSRTLYLADRADDFRGLGLAWARLRFTTETPEACARTLRAHIEGGGIEQRPAAFTRGLFVRGVE